jgi:aryl-alcohol dehydrogenase-like predicted oxidoreductase
MTDLQDRLALGTAQLGARYGIANATGQPSLDEATEIVSAAWCHGVRFFDTAQGYGESERVLGEAFQRLDIAAEARVISKLSPTLDGADAEAVLESLRASITRLGVPRLWGLLLHREQHLDHWATVWNDLFERIKREGLTLHVGVSVYSPERALQALQIPGLDILQVPANLFDRRMRRAQVFAKAAATSATVFIRSIYLQGIALFSPQQATETAPFALAGVAALEKFCGANGLDQKRFAFEYARDISTRVLRIVGAETPGQVVENSQLEQQPPLDPALFRQWDERWPDDVELLVNPTRWPAATVSKQ